MALESTGRAHWEGDLFTGQGTATVDSGVFGPLAVDWKARTEEQGARTNPEELIGAAHAGCFSMALSHQLAQAGHPPKRVHTTANVSFEKQAEGFAITKIDLTTEAEVPGIDAAAFQKLASAAKDGCPVSKALKATPINPTAGLL